MELVFESLAKLRSHSSDGSDGGEKAAEFCAVYERAANAGFEIIAVYTVALLRLITAPVAAPSLPPQPTVKDYAVAATNALRVLSSYYAHLPRVSTLAGAVHAPPPSSRRAPDTLAQTLLKNLTADLTNSATGLISDLTRHLHTTTPALPPNLGVSAITSSAVYAIRVISSFKGVYGDMGKHSRKTEEGGMDGVVRGIVVALMDNVQRQGMVIQETYGRRESLGGGGGGGASAASRRASIDLGAGGGSSESFEGSIGGKGGTRGGPLASVLNSTAYRSVFLLNNCDYLRRSLSPDAARLRRESSVGRFGNVGGKKEEGEAEGDGEGEGEEEEEEPEHEIESSWFADMLGTMMEKAESTLVGETFGTLAGFLEDVDVARFKYQNAKTKLLTLESGRLLKAKFGGFNDTLAAMHATMGGVCLPEEVGERIVNAGKASIVDKYRRFFGLYSEYNFSKKKMDEYLRYPPLVAETIFEELFRG